MNTFGVLNFFLRVTFGVLNFFLRQLSEPNVQTCLSGRGLRKDANTTAGYKLF